MCFKPILPAKLLFFFDICKSRDFFVAFLHHFSRTPSGMNGIQSMIRTTLNYLPFLSASMRARS